MAQWNTAGYEMIAIVDEAGNPSGPSTRGTLTDRSGTCSGVSVQAATANASRRYLLVQNPSAAAGSIWCRVDGSAAVQASPSIEVAPGATLTFEGSFVPTGAVTVIGTAGLPFTIKEG